jgi:hypothetical protein
MEGQCQWCGRGGSGGDAALELALLASQRRSEHKADAKGDPITPIQETCMNTCQMEFPFDTV